MKPNVWRMAWDLMTTRERAMAGLMLAISVVGAAAQVLMIGAIMPFLQVLSDPSIIDTHPVLARIYEGMGFQTSYDFVFCLGGVTILIIILANGIQMLKAYSIHRFAYRRVHSISIRLAKSYLDREYEYFLDKNSGDIGKRILAEASSISNSFLRPATILVASGLSTVAILGFLLFVNPVVTLFGGATVFLVYVALYWMVKGRLQMIGSEKVSANRGRFESINEAIGGIKEIKVLGKEKAFFRKFELASKKLADVEITNSILSDLPRFGVQAMFFAGVVIMCLLLIDAEMFNHDGAALASIIPTLGVFAMAGQRLIPEAQNVYSSLSKIIYGAASVENVHEDMDFSKREPVGKAKEIQLRQSVFLDGVSYVYPGASKPGLTNLRLEIPKGRKLGIVGGTGSGKTTLADVCLGLLPPSDGVFRVDGIAIQNREERQAWRSRVGYVPQDIFIVDGTFADNIAFGVEPCDIDMKRVEECARTSHLHEVIMGQGTEGYDARVGDRGVKLSGGQRQRIGIARALYRGADFLVMDEATSALDNTTERDVIQAIESLPKDMTVVMIAHRLTTLRGCDEIVVLDKGCIVERGSWDALQMRDGHFSKLTRSAGL